GVERGEHALERVEVRMDVGDDGDAHGQSLYSLPTRKPAAGGTVAGLAHVATSRSPHPPATRPVVTAAGRRRRTATPSSAGATRSSQPIVAPPNVASWRRGIG